MNPHQHANTATLILALAIVIVVGIATIQIGRAVSRTIDAYARELTNADQAHRR